MPLYEYQCEKCGDRFEVRQKFSEEPLSTHEKCGGSVHRLISAPALQFKGSGWYVTDYAKGSQAGTNGAAKTEGGNKSEKKDAPSTPSTEKTSSPASDTKSSS